MNCPLCQGPLPAGATTCPSCGAPCRAPQAVDRPDGTQAEALPVGTRLHGEHYGVGRVLGRGSLGITYQGSDLPLQAPVVLKELLPVGCERRGATVYPARTMSPHDFSELRTRFLDEALGLARLRRPGIVHVHGAFEENNTAYMVMEYLRGRTLAALIHDRGSLEEAEVLEILRRVGDALQALHTHGEQGVLHRDIRPANIMVTIDGRVVVTDFGGVRDFAAQVSRAMGPVLAPGYAPLEQHTVGGQVGPTADIYALGATMYHALTGQVPPDAVARAQGAELKPPRTLRSSVSRQTSDALMAALEMSPTRRPRTVAELVDLFKPAGGVGTKPTGPPPAPLPAAPPAPVPAAPPVPQAPVAAGAVAPPASPGLFGWLSSLLSRIFPSREEARPSVPVVATPTAPSPPPPAPAGPAPFSVVVPQVVAPPVMTPPPPVPVSPPRVAPAPAATVRPPARAAASPTRPPTVAPPPTRPPAAAAPAGLRPQATNAQGCRRFLNEIDGTTLIEIPAGTFAMGSEEGPDESPVHPVTLPVFYLAQAPVTNAQFARFVAATGYDPGFAWGEYASQWGDEAPVVMVNWEDATAYARWAGLRLPTEEEWEYAARGPQALVYPWGNEWDPSRCQNPLGTNSFGRPAPVGSYPNGVSPFGCLDMAGNVWEWTDSWYDRYPGSTQVDDGFGRKFRVLRGGSWVNGDPSLFRGANRLRLNPDARYRNIGASFGFRLARSGA